MRLGRHLKGEGWWGVRPRRPAITTRLYMKPFVRTLSILRMEEALEWIFSLCGRVLRCHFFLS